MGYIELNSTLHPTDPPRHGSQPRHRHPRLRSIALRCRQGLLGYTSPAPEERPPPPAPSHLAICCHLHLFCIRPCQVKASDLARSKNPLKSSISGWAAPSKTCPQRPWLQPLSPPHSPRRPADKPPPGKERWKVRNPISAGSDIDKTCLAFLSGKMEGA